MPTDQHGQSSANYQSGHCSVAHHESCRGSYAGTACTCQCHTPELDLLSELDHTELLEEPTAVRHCTTCTCAVTA